LVITEPNWRTAATISRAVAKTPLHLFLAFVALLWLMPTLGLFFTSLLSSTDYISDGWWKIVSKPSLATWANYSNVWNTTDIPTSLRFTAEIAIGVTLLPSSVAALAGYAFAWVEFPGRDWLFVLVIALLVVPLQMALIPVFHLYNTFHLYDTIVGLILFHPSF